LGSAPVAMVTVTTTDVWDPAVVAAIAKCSATPTPDYCPTPQAGAKLGGIWGLSRLYDDWGLFRLPVFWALSAPLPMIRSILEEHGRDGLLSLASVVRGLHPAQRQLLREMFQTWRTGKSLNLKHKALLQLIVLRLREKVR